MSTKTRQGQRKNGITLMTFPLPETLKNDIRRIAHEDGRTASAWLRMKLQEIARRSRAAKRAA